MQHMQQEQQRTISVHGPVISASLIWQSHEHQKKHTWELRSSTLHHYQQHDVCY
jgi:hypothetical protein